jgi:hypothetical protein
MAGDCYGRALEGSSNHWCYTEFAKALEPEINSNTLRADRSQYHDCNCLVIITAAHELMRRVLLPRIPREKYP